MKFEETSRAYFFSNMYLGSLQHGLQAGHVIGEMAIKYTMDDDGPATHQSGMFKQWVKYHKTMIIYNAGYQSVLETIEILFEMSRYPFAAFREEQGALNGALTSVGIVLPQRLIEAAAAAKKNQGWTANDILVGDDQYYPATHHGYSYDAKVDMQIVELVNRSRLAN